MTSRAMPSRTNEYAASPIHCSFCGTISGRRTESTKKAMTAAVATHMMTVIRVISKCTPSRVNSASEGGKNSLTVGEQKPGSSGGHSEARMVTLTRSPSSLAEADGHVVDRGGRADDHSDRLHEGGAQPEVDQPADATPHADPREQGAEDRPALAGSGVVRRLASLAHGSRTLTAGRDHPDVTPHQPQAKDSGTSQVSGQVGRRSRSGPARPAGRAPRSTPACRRAPTARAPGDPATVDRAPTPSGRRAAPP